MCGYLFCYFEIFQNGNRDREDVLKDLIKSTYVISYRFMDRISNNYLYHYQLFYIQFYFVQKTKKKMCISFFI